MDLVVSSNLWRKFCEDEGKWFFLDIGKVLLIWYVVGDWVLGCGVEGDY